MSDNKIYFDNAATCKVSANVAECALKYYTNEFYNPSALYREALSVKKELDTAHDYILNYIGGGNGRIVFTSCATESNNFALECGIKNKKGNIIISAGEHASVYEKAVQLKNAGVDVRIAPLTSDGTIYMSKLCELIDENTALVSVIHVSNETGVVNDIKAIKNILLEKKSRAILHCDGVQALGKIKVNVCDLGADLYSISAHKVGGLKGVGGLYIRNGFNMRPFVIGGGQQNNMRSGTENVGGIMSFALALREFNGVKASQEVSKLRQLMIDKIISGLPNVIIAGEKAQNTGYILSLSFTGIKGEVLSNMLADRGIIVGLGSACSSKVRKSRVLTGMGLPIKAIDGSIRVSFNPTSTENDVNYVSEQIISLVSDWSY